MATAARTTGGAQQRLRQQTDDRQHDRKSSDSSVECLDEVKGTPEKERERGTTSASVRLQQAPVAAEVDYDSSDNEAKDEIRLLQAQMDLMSAKLVRLNSSNSVNSSNRLLLLIFLSNYFQSSHRDGSCWEPFKFCSGMV